MPSPGKDFFVSYNKADRAWAEWIAWQVEAAGNSVVIQSWDFRPGADFTFEMQKATAETERTIGVLSPSFLAAAFTQPEWGAAFREDPTGEKRKLVFVRVEDCQAPGMLGNRVYIDLVGLSKDEAISALLDGLKIGRAKPSASPDFPGSPVSAVENKRGSEPAFPGALPPVWNVPHLRNPNFTGREDLLTAVQTALSAGKAAALPQAITGLGGVGKTQLATEYAYRHASAYRIVWWIRSETTETLSGDYAALAPKLGLPKTREVPAMVMAVRERLQQETGWLLVFDNAEAPETVRPYLPAGGGGHVLVTSRNPAWGAVASPLSVPVMPEDEAIKFLLRRTRQDARAAAAALAAELGYLPLALEQAAAYIEENGRSLGDYLTLFKERRLELLELGRPPSAEYPDTVATTWSLSFEDIEGESPAGAALLKLAAFLAPDEIPRRLIVNGAAYLPTDLTAAARDPILLDKAVGALRRSSLIETGADGFSVHRLVQAVTRDRMEQAESDNIIDNAVRVVNAAFLFDQNAPDTWAPAAKLLPHALAATSWAETRGSAQDETVGLLNGAGLLLQVRAEYAAARSTSERALRIAEKAFGPKHPQAAKCVNNLGSVLRDLGDYAGAKAAFERAIHSTEEALGYEHPNVATCSNNLGTVLQDLGNYAGAKAAYERALRIAEKAFGPEHPRVANYVNSIGDVLRDLGDYSGARAAFERAIRIGEKAFGPEHPRVAVRVNNLGHLLHALGDHAGAKAAFERAIRIDEKAFGPEHPAVATDLSNLGILLLDLGDLAGARATLERTLCIAEKALGPEHPDVGSRLDNLGSVLRGLGDYTGAKAAFERALRIDERAFGPEHPHVASRLNNLGTVLRDLGDHAGARAAFERALRIDETTFGPGHPNIAVRVNNLGGVLQDLGDFSGAKGAFDRALRIAEKVFGSEHPTVATCVKNIGGVLRSLGDLAGAKAAFERALRIDEGAFGLEHPEVATDLNNLGSLLQALGDRAGAKAAIERALRIRTRLLGKDYPSTQTIRRN
jgi:tetratricopeptide (TPR) repeat protein